MVVVLLPLKSRETTSNYMVTPVIKTRMIGSRMSFASQEAKKKQMVGIP